MKLNKSRCIYFIFTCFYFLKIFWFFFFIFSYRSFFLKLANEGKRQLISFCFNYPCNFWHRTVHLSGRPAVLHLWRVFLITSFPCTFKICPLNTSCSWSDSFLWNLSHLAEDTSDNPHAPFHFRWRYRPVAPRPGRLWARGAWQRRRPCLFGLSEQCFLSSLIKYFSGKSSRLDFCPIVQLRLM